MKKFVKGLSIALSTVFIASAGVACGGGGGGGLFGGGNNNGEEKPSENQTTYIRVQNYDCGFGRTYITETVKKFQEAVKDKSYEEGKTGVFVDITNATSESTGQVLLNALKGGEHDVYFTNGIAPYMLNQYKSDLLDLAPILNATSADTENKIDFTAESSIMSRMDGDVKNYYLNDDGTMYTIPLFYNSFLITYDAGLVEEKNLYIQEGSTDTQIAVGTKANASKGVDGEKGTEDDGLPETYAQWFLWMDTMKTRGVTPIHKSGLYEQHMTFALGQFWADFEGYEGTRAAIDFNGREVSDLIDSIDGSGNITYMPKTAITPQNGYLVQKQEGRYRALEVAKKLADNYAKYFHAYAFTSSETHTSAQATYVASKLKGQPIMMFIDGSYWEAEATDKFASFEAQNGGKMDRQFKILPMPKYSRDMIGQDTTLTTSVAQQILVNAKTSGGTLDAVKDFLAFFNTEENMALQNKESSSPRPFSYSISSIENEMSTYTKSLYNTFHGDNVKVALWASTEDFAFVNSEELDVYYFLLDSKYKPTDNVTSYNPVKVMKDEKISVIDWFNGLTDKFTASNNAKWNSLLNRLG